MTDLYLTLRIVDLGLYGIIMLGMIMNRHDFFAANPQVRMMLVGLGGLIVAGTYSTGEILVAGIPGGPRLIILTVPLIFLSVGIHLDFLFNVWRRITTRKEKA